MNHLYAERSRPNCGCERYRGDTLARSPVRRFFTAAASVVALATLAACSEKGPDTAQGRSTTWIPLTASALYVDDSGVLAPHRDRLARANTSCAERLEVARELADVAASPGLRAMVDACAKSGLSFSGELRCNPQGTVEAHCE